MTHGVASPRLPGWLALSGVPSRRKQLEIREPEEREGGPPLRPAPRSPCSRSSPPGLQASLGSASVPSSCPFGPRVVTPLLPLAPRCLFLPCRVP